MKEMKRFGIVILAFLLLAGCQTTAPSISPAQTPAPSPTAAVVTDSPAASPSEQKGSPTVGFEKIDNVFGFADETGTKIITITNMKPMDAPEEYDLAIGYGSAIELEFVGWQDATAQDSGRQTPDNFDNLAGDVFKAKNGIFTAGKTYFLAKSSVVAPDALKTLISLEQDGGIVDETTVKSIEAIKNRKIVESTLLAETAEKGRVCLFVFERIGDDMLASLAYIKDDAVLFKDFPAKYDASSTWRVDAGDKPGIFEVLFMAESDQGLLLGVTWAAFEGENTFVLREENGVFQDTDLQAGRYWSPA